MRILQLCPQFPFPLDHGGAIGIYKIAEALSRHADVTFLSYPPTDPHQQQLGVAAMQKFCDVRLVSRALPSRALTLLKTALKGAYPIERRMMPEMFTLITKVIGEKQFDVVHLDGAQMGRYGLWIKKQFGLPVVLREHNFEALIYERFARNERNPLKKIVASMHGRRVRKEELEFLRGVDAVIPITREDETLMRQEVPNARYEIIPAGVDTQYFQPANTRTDTATIMWVGGMNWEPNKDAVYYFAQEIFPLVRQQYPDAVLELVGAGTDELNELRQQLGTSVRLHGSVADIRPFAHRATVMICPLRVGGGMRLKLLDFFALGKAVVSTSIGAEGNLARDGEAILIRDTPQTFSTALVELIRDEERRARIGTHARQLVEEQYSWEGIGKRLIALYQEVIDHRDIH